MLPIRDAASRMFLLKCLVAAFDEADHGLLARLVSDGFTPELIDRLRGMTMVDALRLCAEHCGLTLGVSSTALQRQLQVLERRRTDRETYEYLIRAGASPRLLCRLFSVPSTEVRHLRKIIAPGLASGGRPRLPDDDACLAIVGQWEAICAREASQRQRFVQLHKAMGSVHPVATLEAVLERSRRPSESVDRQGPSSAAIRPMTYPLPAASSHHDGGPGVAARGA